MVGGSRIVVSCGVTSGEFVSVQLLVGCEVGEIPVVLTVEKSSICSTLFSVEGVSGYVSNVEEVSCSSL